MDLLYEFLCHELQFLFLSPWKAGKFRVDFSFQPSYTVGGSHSRDGSWPGMSASQQDSGIGILVNGVREVQHNFRKTSYSAVCSFFKKWKKRTCNTHGFSLPGEQSLLPHILCFGLNGGTTHCIRLQNISVSEVFLGSRSAVQLSTCFHRIMVTQLRTS